MDNLTPEDIGANVYHCDIRDKAIRWIEEKKKEISGLAGREATSIEKTIVRGVIANELFAALYTDIRKEHGAVAAQETLKQVWGIIPSVLRRNGEEIKMSVRVDFDKMSAAPETYESVPTTCSCSVDMDGRCGECIQTLRNFWSKMGESIKILKEANLTDKICRPCLVRHLDAAMAEFIRTDLSTFDPETAEAFMRSMMMSSRTIQAMPMPLTTRAWNEFLKSRS